MFTCAGVLRERRREWKSRGRRGVGLASCAGVEDRVEDCALEK
jgi:hypothetical protein